MDWTAMPYFLAIARQGTLRGAAQDLGATHATVDRHLKSLEQDYGVRLFDRTRGGMALTVAGEKLLPLAENAEIAMNGARARLMGMDAQEAGRIRVSVPPAMAYSILPEIFADFCKVHPDIDLSFSVTNRFEDLNRLEADVSIRLANDVTEDVVGRKVIRTYVGIYCTKAYYETRVLNAQKDGEGLEWVSWSSPEEARNYVQNTAYPKATVRHVSRNVWMQREMIRNGMGFGYLPAMYAENDPDLVRMPHTQLEPNRWIWLLLHGELRKTKRVRLFVDHMAAALKERRGLISGGVET